MSYKPGDKVWANFIRLDLNLMGELPGVIVGAASGGCTGPHSIQ